MDEFVWNLRVRSTSRGLVTVYTRSQQIEIGVPVQFDPEYPHVTALEQLLAAFGADLVNGLRLAARRRHVLIDAVEAVVRGELDNPLVYLGVVGETGHPGLARIQTRVYVSTDADEEVLQPVWQETLRRSPLVNTFQRAVALDLSVKIIA